MEYTINILNIKLWEWKAVLERADFEMTRFGPDEHNSKAITLASEHISELTIAIETLSKPLK